MKNYRKQQFSLVLGLAVLFLFAANVLAQNETQVAAIRAEVKAIDKGANKYKKETKSVSGLSLEGAEANYFLADQTIKKITAKMYGETYNATAEIYYKGDQPIFIFFKNNKYKAPIQVSSNAKIVSSEEQRIYFENGKTLKIMVGKNTLKPADARFGETEKSLREISEVLMKGYSEENP